MQNIFAQMVVWGPGPGLYTDFGINIVKPWSSSDWLCLFLFLSVLYLPLFLLLPLLLLVNLFKVILCYSLSCSMRTRSVLEQETEPITAPDEQVGTKGLCLQCPNVCVNE